MTPDEVDDEYDERKIIRTCNCSTSRGRECRAYPLITPVIMMWLGG